MGREVLIDTDVLILLVKTRLLPEFLSKFTGHISVITLYEYIRGRAYFGHSVDDEKKYLESMFTVVGIDNRVIRKLCELYVELRRRGELVPDPNLINAAIAIVNDLPLATANIRHYQRLTKYGLRLITWEELKSQLETRDSESSSRTSQSKVAEPRD